MSFLLSSAPLDPAALARALADPRAGACVTFEGWVRNRNDGSVEAHVQGPAAAVETLIAWCRQGPPHADVAGVAVTVGFSPVVKVTIIRLASVTGSPLFGSMRLTRPRAGRPRG